MLISLIGSNGKLSISDWLFFEPTNVKGIAVNAAPVESVTAISSVSSSPFPSSDSVNI